MILNDDGGGGYTEEDVREENDCTAEQLVQDFQDELDEYHDGYIEDADYAADGRETDDDDY